MGGLFKRISGDSPKTATPEELFSALKGRSPNIRGLLSQQADVLRDYSREFVEKPDVAVELPTGAGKTLIGLLIAEWRRRTRDERAIYLCPTIQLVHQVAEKAALYGIEAVRFVGGKEDFSPADLQAYNSNAKIAIAPYARIFNVSPGIAEPNFIVMDDAHASEQYVAGMWSLLVDEEFADIRDQLLEILKPFLSSAFIGRLEEGTTSFQARSLELIQAHSQQQVVSSIRDFLDGSLAEGPKKLYFKWKVLREHLHACNVFVSSDEILIRPYIPPTLTHRPFASASQRLFLSATLGPSGSLERMVGVRSIKRMATPPLMKGGGIGRRFFLFPSAVLPRGESIAWALGLTKSQPRSLVVCRDHSLRKAIAKNLRKQGLKVLSADDVEESLAPFINSTNTALVVATRFDGIDLPEDACRITVLVGEPNAVNLQERFMLTRLGMRELLQDRVVTRFMQASGRCTRGETDFSLVVPASQDLLDFVSRRENRRAMHSVVAAEVGFGLEQSSDSTPESLDKMASAFFQQSSEWKEVDQEIARYTDSDTSPSDLEVEKLVMANADKEVEFGYALWEGPDLEKAAQLARDITDHANVKGMSLYRAWWAYQTGACYYWLQQRDRSPQVAALAERFFGVARGAAGLASWYSNLPHVVPNAKVETNEAEERRIGLQVENVLEQLRTLGLRGPRFETEIGKVTAALKGLGADEAKEFELSLKQLGLLLGWDASRPNADGSPDGVWQFEGSPTLVFEAKSGKESTNAVSKDDCVQAGAHQTWLKATHGVEPTDSHVFIISSNAKVHPVAKPHLAEIFHVEPKALVAELERAAEALRQVRLNVSDLNSPEARDAVRTALIAEKLRPEEVLARLTLKPLTKLAVQP